MQSLKLNRNVVRFCIDDDPARVVSFDPSDVLLYERVLQFYRDIQARQAGYELRAREIDVMSGVEAQAEAAIALVGELARYVRGEIDVIFGAGTAQAVFGDAFSFEAFGVFIEYVTNLFSASSQDRVNARLNRDKGEDKGEAVM